MVVMTNIDLEQDVAVEQLIPDGQFADLLAFIGHELRTPLTSVAACAELLETADDPVEREVFAATMRRQIGRLMLVFDAALRAAGTLDGGGDLSTDVKGALEHAARRLTEFDSRIEVRVACVPMARACMDTAALEMVLDNLVLNAAKHSRGRTVVLSGEERDGTIEIRVEDDGEGVREELRETVFRRGARIGASSGHGLGLFVARELLRRSGGDLRLDASPLGGASFRLTLQISEVSHGE